MQTLNYTIDQVLTAITGHQSPWRINISVNGDSSSFEAGFNEDGDFRLCEFRGSFNSNSRLVEYFAILGQDGGDAWHAASAKVVYLLAGGDDSGRQIYNELQLHKSFNDKIFTLHDVEYLLQRGNLVIKPSGSLVVPALESRLIERAAAIGAAAAATSAAIQAAKEGK